MKVEKVTKKIRQIELVNRKIQFNFGSITKLSKNRKFIYYLDLIQLVKLSEFFEEKKCQISLHTLNDIR